MASKDARPAWFQKFSAALPAQGQAKLTELHTEFDFDEDKIDCFNINSGSLSMDNLEEFCHFLEKEASKVLKVKEVVLQKPKRASVINTPARSAGLGAMFGAPKRSLPTGLAASLAPSLSAARGTSPDRLTTPNAKRSRESADDSDLSMGVGRTPEPPTRVSVKSSVNQNLPKPEPAATATQIRLMGDSSLWTGQRGGAYRWMDEAIEERAAAQDAQLTAMEGPLLAAIRARPAARLSLTDGEEEVATGTVGAASQAEVVVCGRLVCEGLEGRLNERSILLEGSRASCNGARVQLNLAGCPQIAAFPGQIVGVLGRSGMSGSTFHARDFVASLPSTAAVPRPEAQLHLMVAAGPFCLRDGLDFAPLEQVFAHAARTRPRVLLLLGPFLDAGNIKVSSGDTVCPGEQEPRSYEEVYTQYLLPMLARGIAPLRQTKTEVLLVPSLDETLCFHPLPQPPLDASLSVDSHAFSALRSLGVKLLPNPAHLEINGLRISASSADALSPVLREMVLRPPERKIEEALRLLLGQRTLFPVLPRDPVQVSEPRAGALSFPYAAGAAPDLCIFPSAIGGANGTFVDGTAFVNPGVLCRAQLGTFAEVSVLPDRLGAQGGTPLKLSERTRVDIMKIDG